VGVRVGSSPAMIDSGLAAFKKFLVERDRDLRRIASHTRNEYALSDVRNESWVMSEHIQRTRGIAIDFANREYQNILLSFLYQKFVRYTEHLVRNAVKLDQSPWGDEPDGKSHPLLNQLSVDDAADPVTLLMEEQSSFQQSNEPDCHHSLASAYVHLLRRFNNKVSPVADYLLISVSYCYRCCARARLLARSQHLMPITGQLGDANLVLKPWRKYRIRRTPIQLVFNFDAELALR
jgi:hypothetical protein